MQGHKGTGISYGTNSAEQVSCWRLDADGLPVKSGYYAAGQLEYKQTTEEDGQRTEVFSDVVDGEERVLLTIGHDGNVAHATYQVYDERGRLCWVLPPEATDRIAKAGLSAEILHRYAYHYSYDAWGHLSMKRLPGCEPEYFIYDACDRLVMSQDGKQREQSAGRWAYNRYDDLERVTEIGEIELNTVQTPAQLQAIAGVNAEYVPQGTFTPLQVMRYDDYLPTTLIPAGNFVNIAGYDAQPCPLSMGLLTGQAQRVLGTDQWLATTFWYDERGREIQRESNNLPGGSSRVCSGYDFTDRLVRLRESHRRDGGAEDVAEMVNTYDPRGRILTSRMVLNGQGTAEISYRYDALGRMAGKTYGTGAHALTETMSYNVRSWLTEKNSGLFRMKLRYEAPEKAVACYNGSISEWEWQQGTGPVNLYSFTYDGLGRLTDATGYTRNATDWIISNDHTEKGLSYDQNGNLLTLQRTSGGTASSYTYQYSGNQLTALTKDGTSGNYSYDANGNMVVDSRRGLVLSYNSLNLLDEASAGGQLAARYSYLADGSKLRVRDAQGRGYDYLGSLIYRCDNGALTLEGMLFSDGQIRRTGSAYETHYFLRDHLGSVRQVVNGATGLPVESNDYYPFGGHHSSASTFSGDHRYRYNGKEVQTTGNLGYLDYGARMYDTELVRWLGVDPESEGNVSVSPYAFCGGNPVSMVDADGRDYWSTTNPAEISRFLNSLRWDYRNPLEHFDFGGWEHETDRDFLNGLTFNDRTRRFMFDYGALVNREASRIGVSWKADMVFGYSASYLTYYGRYVQPREEWYAKASGRATPDYTLETVGIPLGKGLQLWMQAARYSRLVKAAQRLYPNKAGKIEMHHITPKYIGGDKNGPLVPLDGAYHQQITNAFRTRWRYGQGAIKDLSIRNEVIDGVYKKYPLPRGYKYK